MKCPTYPLLIAGSVKGGTASAAAYFGVHHETPTPGDIMRKGGLSTGLVYPSVDGIWRDTRDHRVIGQFKVVVQLTRSRQDHLMSLMKNARYLPGWYPGHFKGVPTIEDVEKWLFFRTKAIKMHADKVIAVESLPVRIK